MRLHILSAICLFDAIFLFDIDRQQKHLRWEEPVLVMRDTTERTEAVEAGTVKLVGRDAEMIIENVNLLSVYDRMAKAHNPYGHGRACERVEDYIKQYFAKCVSQMRNIKK